MSKKGRQWNIYKLISWSGVEVKKTFNRTESVAIDFLGDRIAEGWIASMIKSQASALASVSFSQNHRGYLQIPRAISLSKLVKHKYFPEGLWSSARLAAWSWSFQFFLERSIEGS